MNPKIRAAALDFIKSSFRPGMVGEMTHELHDAYAAECQLFNVHFKGMSKSESHDYHKFVTWLDNSGMWNSDLTVDELWDVFESLEYDLLMECYEDSLEDLEC
jgi:hypothetical protein